MRKHKRILLTLAALALAILLPTLALADGGHGFGGRHAGGMGISAALTDEQQVAYDAALATYQQLEDAVLSDLVGSGALAQADVDAHKAQREGQQALGALDMSAWTTDQQKAYYEANAKTGDERKAAFDALVGAGQLTQAQADALTATVGDSIWSKLAQNADTNSGVQTALSTLKQAQRTFRQALADAGIEGVGKGFGMGFAGGMQGFDKGGMHDQKDRQGKMDSARGFGRRG